MKAIKVKVGLRPNGHADYPDFNQLPCVQASGMDWSHYIDKMGHSWHYDKTSGHQDDTVDSPRGMQWGMLVVPEIFAIEALAAFPALVTVLNEVEAADFWDNKAHAHEPSILEDKDVLDSIVRKQQLGIPLTQEDNDALNPAKPQRGRRKNDNRLWSDYKTKHNLVLKP